MEDVGSRQKPISHALMCLPIDYLMLVQILQSKNHTGSIKSV